MHAPDGLVHRPQLGQGERRSDECRCDAPEVEVDADTLDRIADDLCVIERQLDLAVQRVGHRNEGGPCSVGAGDDLAHFAKHCEVGDRDDVHSRIAPRIAVGAELGQQARPVDTGLLGQLPLRRLVQSLGGPFEAARDRPHPFEGRDSPTHEQHVKPAVGHGQDDDVHRDCECRELRWIVVRRHSRISRFGRHGASP